MIILFCILLLVVLVYFGIQNREGMTTTVASQMIDILERYYLKKKTNEAETPPIDNTKNAESTMTAMIKLKITDEVYKGIISNDDLNNESKINMIKTTLGKALSQNEAVPKMTIDTYKGLLGVLNDSSATNQPEQKINEVKQIVYDNVKDPRFVYIFDGTTPFKDDKEKLAAIQTAAYNTLNPT